MTLTVESAFKEDTSLVKTHPLPAVVNPCDESQMHVQGVVT